MPLYLVNTDRGQEGTARPPASLGPLGPPGPATTPAGSPLTFPTLDDFIPPRLQRRPHHSQPAGAADPHPPVSQTPPSFSPPPPLLPPAPEGLLRASEPDLTGAVSSTVSLLESPPHSCPECLLLAVKTPLTEVLSREGRVRCHCARVATGPVCASPECMPPARAPAAAHEPLTSLVLSVLFGMHTFLKELRFPSESLRGLAFGS